MKVSVVNMAGNKVGTVDLPSSVFEAKVNLDLMHQALVRQLANGRRGTHSAKTRSEVTRTGAKWYRQKGTGRARHGSKRAPIFVGGGVAHGPKPRSYAKNMPRKMRRAALRSALTVKANNDDIVVLDRLEMERTRTSEVANLLGKISRKTSTLLLLADKSDAVGKSARNLHGVKALGANYLNIRDLLGYDTIVMSLSALDVIHGYLAVDKSTVIVADISESAGSFEEEE
jgi:large subunit ribosomal protein L4